MKRFDGIIFDMDGTLIDSLLDFVAIRRRLGIPDETGILEGIDAMPPDRRTAAADWLLEQEMKAVLNAPLLPGVHDLLDACRKAGLKTALLTRNAQQAMEAVIEKFQLAFDLAWSRENGPIKPEPDGVLRACRTLGIKPERTACVGDFKYDIIAANAAGATSILLATRGLPDFAGDADYVVTELAGLHEILGI